MNNVGKHFIISGRVQGVGFRYFTYRNAKELRINGWVKNLRDGTVEAVLSGSPENIKKMTEKLREGPHSANVERVQEMDNTVDPAKFNDFSIRR